MTGKLKIVVSDLHIGAGYFAGTNPLEDFTADQEFVTLLETVRAESDWEQKEVEFIINGDLFDFLQVPAVPAFDPTVAYPPQAYLNTSAESSLQQLEIIARHHPEVFTALANFISLETPIRRITIIKGNRDVNLYWPQLKTRLRKLLGATGVKASLLLFAEEFINREGLYIEHGHQRAEKANRFPDFKQPLNPADPTRLFYPPGSVFVANYLNDTQRSFQKIDRIKPLSALIWYTLKWDFNLAADLLIGIMQNIPGLLNRTVPADEAPALDALLIKLQNPEYRQATARRYATDAAFKAMLHQEIQYLLNSIGLPQYPRVFQLPPAIDPLAMAQTEQQQIHQTLKQEATRIIAQNKVGVVLFGHTHIPIFQKLSRGGFYLNTGAWLWHETMTRPQRRIGPYWLMDQSELNALRYLPYARIDYDETDTPEPRLIDFSGQGFSWGQKKLSLLHKLIALLAQDNRR